MLNDMKDIKRFISALMTAISNCSLYSKEHVSVNELTQKALSILNELLKETDSLELMVVEGELIIKKMPLRDVGPHITAFLRRVKRKGISRIDFVKGITLHELKQFIADISETDKGLKSYPHIRPGIIDVRIGGLKMDSALDMDKLMQIASGQVKKIKEVYHDISPFRRLDIAGLEEIVVNFILTFRRETSILKLISPVKSHSDYTYTHATNVEVLALMKKNAGRDFNPFLVDNFSRIIITAMK